MGIGAFITTAFKLTGLTATLVAAVIETAISLAVSYAKGGFDKAKTNRGCNGQQIKSNTRGTNEDIKIVYGKFRVGGNNVYVNTFNALQIRLHYAHTLCEGEIEGIEYDSSGNPYIWFNGERIHEKYSGTGTWYIPLYQFQEKTGSNTQLANTLITDLTDPMRNTAYVAWVMAYDENKYRGIPQIQYLIKGRLLYDFRNATTAWSDNPVLALYDYFTNKRYGVGLDSSLIDISSWEEAANYCDTKEFKINAVIYSSDNVWSNITTILDLFRGNFTYWDGIYYLKFKDLNEEISVFTIEDKHIFQDENGKSSILITDPGYYDLPTGVRVNFINAENNLYVNDSIPIGEENDLMIEYNLPGCTDRKMAGILGTYYLERLQLSRTISGTFRDDCITLEPGDIVTLNTSSMGIADQALRVSTSQYIKNGLINLSFEYEDIDLYNDVYDINPEAVYDTTLPNASEPCLIENATIGESTYNYRLRTLSKLDIEFDIPSESWFKEVEVYISTNGDVEANYKHQLNAKDNFSIDPVEEGVTYYILLRTVNTWGTKQDLDQATKLSKTIIGQSNVSPDSLTYLNGVSGDGSVSLRSDKLLDPDIEIYEFRLGSQWSGGIFLSAKRSPHEELSLVKPGTHTFWANTKGTNSLYGDNPQSTTLTVLRPNSWTNAYTTFTDNYLDSTSNVFVNTEPYEYNLEDTLKCSHSPAELVTNGGFDSATTGWTPSDCTIASVSGGQSGNCLEVTRTGGTYQLAHQTINTVIGLEYKVVGYIKSGTSGDESYAIKARQMDWTVIEQVTGVSSSTWSESSFTFTAIEATTRITLLKNGSTAGTMLFDTISCVLNNPLTGRYISEEFDTGVVAGDYYVYLDTEILTIGAGTTWGDLFIDSAATTWIDVNADSRPWQDMFEITEAPKVTISIKYRAEITHDWSVIENAQILAGVINARYFQVEIDITDPAVNVNALVESYTLRLFN